MGLCQDTEHAIRGALCTQLSLLAEGLFVEGGKGAGDEGRVRELGEELIELLRDEDGRVSLKPSSSSSCLLSIQVLDGPRA